MRELAPAIPRLKLKVAYDGTDFCGWAAQSGRRTIQETLRQAVLEATRQDVEIVGASRTDSGAHASGQICHFDTEVPVEPDRWVRMLNKLLPPDVAIVQSGLVPNHFHARFSAVDRFYRYRILTGPRDPLRSRFMHEYGRGLDVEAMNRSAQALVGDHDFLAYTEELDPDIENTRRRMNRIQVRQVRDEVWVEVVGTAFLRGMMRRMSGALLEVGRGKRPAEEISLLLTEDRANLQWPVVLPARGLCLVRIRYGRHPRDNRGTARLS